MVFLKKEFKKFQNKNISCGFPKKDQFEKSEKLPKKNKNKSKSFSESCLDMTFKVITY